MPNGDVITTHQDADACSFLLHDKLCAIHKEIAYAAKPKGCQQFPLVLHSAPEGVYVGLSFYCDAVARNEGRPMSVHAPWIEGWLSAYPEEADITRVVRLSGNQILPWQGYLLLESRIRQTLEDSPTLFAGLWRAFVGVCRAATGFQGTPPSPAWEAKFRADMDTGFASPTPDDPIFSRLALTYTAAAIGVVEAPRGIERKGIIEAVTTAGSLKSAIFGKTIDLKKFLEYQARHPALWRIPQYQRYVGHLIFRKFLATPHAIVHNAAALHTAGNLLDFYFYLSAFQANKSEPDIADVHRAVDVVEAGFTTHTRGMLPFLSAFVEGVQSQLACLDGDSAP